jgi:sec-independent protein translocase protein TatA
MMEFLGIGPGELLLILVIALIVFGPRRLPEIGRTLGKAIRDFREASQGLTDQLRSEIDAASGELTAASDELSGHQTQSSSRLPDMPAGQSDVSHPLAVEQPPMQAQKGPDATDQELR